MPKKKKNYILAYHFRTTENKKTKGYPERSQRNKTAYPEGNKDKSDLWLLRSQASKKITQWKILRTKKEKIASIELHILWNYPLKAKEKYFLKTTKNGENLLPVTCLARNFKRSSLEKRKITSPRKGGTLSSASVSDATITPADILPPNHSRSLLLMRL